MSRVHLLDLAEPLHSGPVVVNCKKVIEHPVTEILTEQPAMGEALELPLNACRKCSKVAISQRYVYQVTESRKQEEGGYVE